MPCTHNKRLQCAYYLLISEVMTLCGWRKRNIKNNPRNNNKSPIRHQNDEMALPDDDVDGAAVTQLNDVDSPNMGNPRNKCALRPGHSLMDWIRLGSSGCDLAGTKGVIRPISHAELATHSKQNDAWLAIRGKCFNVTRYIDFHPGGADEIMKGVGKDATKIFDEVHAWVNYEQLLSKCYVGPLINTAIINLDSSSSKSTLTHSKSTNGGFKAPSQILPFLQGSSVSATTSPNKHYSKDGPSSVQSEVIPRFDWIQRTPELIIIFYTRAMCNPGFSVECLNDVEVVVRIFIERTMHICHFKFAHPIRWPCTAKMSNETGKMELIFKKLEATLWTSFGLLDRRKTTELACNSTFEYDVISRVPTTHDSYAIVLKPKKNVLQHFPIGYHISVTAEIQGTDTTRSYTPVPLSFIASEINDCCPPSCIPLLIKSYDSGNLSKHLTQPDPLASSLYISYPKGNFQLTRIRSHCRIALLAAGSGVTPMLSILEYLIQRVSNKLEAIIFVYFNKMESDIWCRSHLKYLTERDQRIQLMHILSEPQSDTDWPAGQIGRITPELIAPLLNPESPLYVTFCCVCGPVAFNDLTITLLKGAGFDADSMHVFRG